jgi:mono/diheme cytochrome c family protein
MKRLLSALLFSSLVSAQEHFSHETMMQVGKKIYEETCISCHGVNGETDPQMKLVVRPRQLNKSILNEEQMFKIVKFGAHEYGSHADIMPTFKYVYDDNQIRSVVHYVSETFNKDRESRIKKLLGEATKLTAEQKQNRLKVGKKIFHRKCGMCHGDTGNGESEYVEQSKSDENFIYPYNLQKILLNEDQIFLYAKFGGHFWGTAKNDMPSWKKRYNDVKLKSVAHYVHEKINKRK